MTDLQEVFQGEIFDFLIVAQVDKNRIILLLMG